MRPPRRLDHDRACEFRDVGPRLLVLGLLVAAVSAVIAPDAVPEMSRVPRQTDRAAWNQYVREGWDSPFGLDYVFALNREFRKPDLARNECYNELFWGGSAEEYGAHLHQVARAARRACPQVKIILSGVCFMPMSGFYAAEMEPRTRAYVDRLLPRTAPVMLPFLKRMDEFSRASLEFILDARRSNYGVVARCREELRQAGRPATEIWSAECTAPCRFWTPWSCR